ncbi:expressed unknown protein [Seminavis robusta]|uniref:Uncharacterized protein n=1 Tax=Seminavis robusta TaxID=568900 RepID=A0A9N8DD29_9STRA|nr:expressed unknown protein [Seminavis robusta]|eukprot:Sro68_g037930.1 n/a (349) ;mRNA; f:18126-19172
MALLSALLFWVALPSTTMAASTVDDNSNHFFVDPWDIYHPLDEGLWRGSSSSTNDPKGDVLQEEDVTIDGRWEGLRNNLRLAEIDSMRLLSRPPLSHHNGGVMKPLSYSIFQTGKSALSSLDPIDKNLIQPGRLFGLDYKHQLTGAHYRACAALLLLRGYSDAAHEILLGVTLDNLEDAVYAATHRGQTNWAEQHPLSDGADILHAAIHRLVEGNDLGEGDQTGYDNARYWYAGGPKLLATPAGHPVRTALARIAQEHTPRCLKEGNVVAGSAGAKHTVLSGGGKTRTVSISCGQWDDFAFLELCQKWDQGAFHNDRDMEDEVATLQRAEIILLLRHELFRCLRGNGM